MYTVDQVLKCFQLGLFMKEEAATILRALGCEDAQIEKALNGHPATVLSKGAVPGQVIYLH